MLTTGVDSHRHSLTAVAVDPMRRQQATIQVPTTASGRERLLDWADALLAVTEIAKQRLPG